MLLIDQQYVVNLRAIWLHNHQLLEYFIDFHMISPTIMGIDPSNYSYILGYLCDVYVYAR